ncbi:MAG: FmdB family zinc ribbon protein [Planctomycetota bacterium]|jgi:putative FmdB family regulatory protein
MPTYEYVCEKCGHKFERFQAITARPIRKCPECGKSSAKRLIGVGSGIIFKGSGFYETDYRSESYKKAAKSEKGTPDTAAEKKTDKKAKDSKTADKPKTTTKDKKKTA